MPEKTRREKDENAVAQNSEPGSWEDDQKLREYYYDDTHGYNTYVPDEGLDDDDQSSEEKAARD
ncbi:MAG: hypothetical protein LC730_05165 [Acidobacteria bacterium]|nr:hypothetical protein [Acidobacteriota bacterium]MCA1608835.1 hypothetical protein [Acidobacteriota bacterium]